MQYPHEREERQQLLTALVADSHESFKHLIACTFVTGVFICALSLASSFLFHTAAETSKLAWVLYWNLGIFCTASILFFLPLFLHRENKKLWGIKRSFVIKSLIPPLLTGLLLGNITLFQASEHYLFTPLLWACGLALSLFSLAPFSLAAVRNLAVVILTLALSTSILALRHSEPSFVPHQLANLSLLICVGLPCLVFSLFKILLKK